MYAISQWLKEVALAAYGVTDENRRADLMRESGGTAAADYTAWTLDTDYYTWPYNHLDLGVPILRLIADWNGDKDIFPCYRKAIKVVGVFGFSSTPPVDVQQACKIQAVRWFARAKQLYQDAGAAAQTGQLIYAQSLDPDIKELLRSYQIGNMV